MVKATRTFLLCAFAPLVTIAFMPRCPLSGQQALVRPPLGRKGLVERRASTVEISQQKGEGQQGGRATVFVERAWNSSTMGAMPHDLASFTKEISDCVLTAMFNGELGLTVTAGGEFEPSNKFFNPLQFTALVTQLASKLCVLGQTRVLFSGPGMLQTVFKEMQELAALEARREQEEMGVVAAVRRQVQARHPGAAIPEVPAAIAREKELRAREKQRLAENVQWGSLLGRDTAPLTSADMVLAALQQEIDLDNDRMILIIAPGNSPAEVAAVRLLIKAAGKRPVIILNHHFNQVPLEMSIFTEAYHMEMRKLKTGSNEPSMPLPSRLDDWASPRLKEISAAGDMTETCLLRKFPYPWQIFGEFKNGEGFELVNSYESKPSPEEIRSRVSAVVQKRRAL